MTLDVKYENEQILYFMYDNMVCSAPVRGCHLDCDFASKAMDITYHFKARDVDSENKKNDLLYFTNVFPSKEELLKSL